MQTLRNIGKINFRSEIPKAKGQSTARKFLESLLIEFARQSAKYINAVGEPPFHFKERQLNSIIAPAISKITPAFLMESPIHRRFPKLKIQQREDYNGWIDYWCEYRGRQFMIELKHDFDNYKSEIITKPLRANWNHAINTQLKVLKSEAKDYSQYCKGVILMPIHIIVVYETVPSSKVPDSPDNTAKLISIQERFHTNLKPNPNWSGLWVLNQILVEKCIYNKTHYPALIMLSRPSEMIKL
jgi:hypothetical protein